MMWKIFKMQAIDVMYYIIAAYLLWIIGWIMVWLIPFYMLYKLIEFIAELWKNSSSRD
jgi:cobalamin biosynthesis protein CobD/CbiB